MKVVKRKGSIESYDERKIYASIYAACRAVKRSEEESESVANEVSSSITDWMGGKGEVTSEEILSKSSEILKHFSEGAALLYRSHMDVS